MNKFKFSTIRRLVLISLISGVGVAHGADFTPPGTVYTPSWGVGPGVSLGNDTYSGGNSVAIGAHASTSNRASGSGTVPTQLFSGAVAVGNYSKAAADYSVAIGQSSNVSGDWGVAISGSATQSGSVALGQGALAGRAAGQFGTSTDGTAFTEAVSFGNVEDKTIPVWESKLGIASIGSDTQTRQLTGLAAGSQDNDAVNVAQLKSLQQSSVFGSGASIQIPEDATDPINVVPARDAVNATVLGDNAKVQVDNGVAIGANSVATMAGRTAEVQFNNSEATGGAWKSEGLVSFGGSYTNDARETVNFNRQITGVAAGSEDNDAVNVAQLREVNNQVQGLVTGDTKVSTIQLTSDPEDENAPTIGLRYQAAEAAPAAQADGDSVTPTASQGRLVYSNVDANGNNLGTVETIATLNDGIKLSGGTTIGAGGAEVDSVNVNLNQGISFLGDEYLQTTVTAGENGGAVVTVGASQALKDFLANSGVQPSDPSNPSNPGGGSTGGTWTPNAAQQAALNGNFANGITVAAGEGNQAIQIKQGNVDMGGNRIQNVGNPINDGDAANKAYVDSTSRSLRNKINDVDKDLRAGVAMAMAVGNLPQAYMPGKSILAVSAGTYHGQGGFALGLSHATDNRQWVFKGAASVDTRGNFGGTLSAGYQF